jgi:hypothetical protein
MTVYYSQFSPATPTSGVAGTSLVDSNSSISIDGSGVISGIGTGNGTTVSNSAIVVDLNGRLQGIGAGNNTPVANSFISINSNGTLTGAGSGSVTYSGLGGGEIGLLSEIYFGQPTLRETTGGSVATLANFKTSIGTAASITGQAATATSSDFSVITGATKPANNATVGARAGTNMFRTDGTTVLTQAEIRTAEGTAASIVSQGAFATLNSAAYGSSLLTGFGTLAPRNTVLAGTHLQNAAGTAFLGDADIITSAGTAASITGQAATATSSDFSVITGATKPANNATVGARAGTNIFRTDGTTVMTQAEIRTAEGTAAFINGQGDWATLNDVAATPLKLAGIVQADALVDDMAYASAAAFGNLWTPVGPGEITVLSDALAPGGKYIRIGNNAGNDNFWGYRKEPIPYDPTALYEVSFVVRQNAGTGLFYAGLAGLSDDKVTLVNQNGLNTTSSQHYIVASAVAVPSTWTTYTGYIRGYGASTGSSSASPNPATPAVMHPNTRYISPLFIGNFSNQAGQFDIAYVRIRRIDLARLGSMVTRQDGTTLLTDAAAVTSLGTAAAIAGQAATATSSDFSVITGTTKPANNATVGARAGTNIFRTDGTTVLTQAEIRTAEGTAASITGQGPGATAPADDILNYTEASGVTTVARPSGGQTSINAATITGALKIALPITTFTNVMMRFRVEVFDYSTGRSSTYYIAGYPYAGTGTGGYWVNCSAQFIGREQDSKPVTFGHDGTNVCVWIGTVTSTWSYLTVTILDFMGRGSLVANTYKSGWALSTTTVEPINGGPGLSTQLIVITKPRAADAVFGENVFEAGSGATATLANFKTSVGTAAAITGQAATATSSDFSVITGVTKPANNATVGARAGTNMFRTDGTTVLTQAEIRTVEGTAASITGQGAFATLSSAAYGSSLLTGFGTLAPRNTVLAGTHLQNAAGTAFLGDADIITSAGTAASITGQAATATSSDFSVITGTTKPANNATVGARAGTNMFRTDGTTVLTQAEIRTAEGTAASITGQGTLATKSAVDLATAEVLNKSLANVDATANTKLGGIAAGATVGARAGTNIYRTDGTTVMSQAEIRTAEGTAASITGQAATATSSDFSVITGTTKPANNATVGAVAGTNMFRTDGTTVLTQAEIRTAEGTAASITGQGALATKSAVAWATEVSGRDVFLTDGRIDTGLDTSGRNKVGIISAGGVPFLNADILGTVNGTNIAANPEFLDGTTTGWSLYDNSGGGKTSIAIVADAAAPNASGNVLRVSYNGTGVQGSNPTPGYGGAVQYIFDALNTHGSSRSRPGHYSRGTTIIYSIVAKLPVGYNIEFASNAFGNEGSFLWMTSTAGTGGWQRYIGRQIIGTTGTFSSTGYLYAINGPNSAFTWDIAKYDQIDITSAARTFLGRGGLTRETGVGVFDNDAITSLGTSAAITGQGALATKSAVDLATSEVLNKSLANVDATANTKLGGIAAGATVGARAGTNIYRTDGTTVMSQAEIRTAEGTAASITGQAATATSSDFSVITGTTKPANNATVGARAGTNIYRTDGTTVMSQAEIRTAEGTAASITGQGALATRSNARLGTEVVDEGGNSIAAEFIRNNVNRGSFSTIQYPSGGSFSADVNGLTGAVQIMLPHTFAAGHYTMMKFQVDIYNYVDNSTVTYDVSGYVYPVAGAPTWYNCTAKAVGGGVGSVKPVRFGRTGSATTDKFCVWIGDVSTVWYYPKVQVRNLLTGYSSIDVSIWESGWAVSTVTTLGAIDVSVPNPTSGDTVFGLNARETWDGAVATLANFKTSQGTAAAFTGQGALATKSAVNLASTEVTNKSLANLDSTANTKLTGIEAGADVTINAQVIATPPDNVIINADYLGAIISGQFNKVLTPTVLRGGASVRTDNRATYSVSNITGGLSGFVSVNNTTGSADKGRVTVTNCTANGTFLLSILWDGVTISSFTIAFTVVAANPPLGGGGSGGTKSGSVDLTGISYTGTTFVQVGRINGLTKAAGETISCTLAAATYQYVATTSGNRSTLGKFQYSVSGAESWTDVGTAVTGSPSYWYQQDFSGDEGSITVNQSVAPSNATYDIRFVVAHNTSGGGNSTFSYGTMAVIIGV